MESIGTIKITGGRVVVSDPETADEQDENEE